MLNELKSLLLKLYGIWLLADLIVTALSLLWVGRTGKLEDILVELIMNAVLGSIPFPFNLLVASQLNTISLILHLVFFFLLLSYFLYKDPDFLSL